MSEDIQFFADLDQKPEEYTATVTLSTVCFADLGPVLDAIEAVVALAPSVSSEVTAEKYLRTFYGWDFDQSKEG